MPALAAPTVRVRGEKKSAASCNRFARFSFIQKPVIMLKRKLNLKLNILDRFVFTISFEIIHRFRIVVVLNKRCILFNVSFRVFGIRNGISFWTVLNSAYKLKITN